MAEIKQNTNDEKNPSGNRIYGTSDISSSRIRSNSFLASACKSVIKQVYGDDFRGILIGKNFKFLYWTTRFTIADSLPTGSLVANSSPEDLQQQMFNNKQNNNKFASKKV
ncbi:hypothetical protein CCACVL1_03486, partial [Corchorus capsularis]